MTALTEARQRDLASGVDPELASFGVANGAVIHKGAFVSLNAGGFLVPAANGLATDRFVGLAEDSVDNTGGVDGDVRCDVRQNGTLFVDAITGATGLADLLDQVAAPDSGDLSKTLTGNPIVGVIENYESGRFAVRFRSAALR